MKIPASPITPAEQSIPAKATRPRRRRATLLWMVQIALAAVFISVGVAHLVDTRATFEQIGLGEWLRYVTGAVEVAGGIGVLIPRLAGAAALGLVGVMIGAMVANILVLIPAMVALNVALAIASAVVAWARRDEIRSLLAIVRR